LRKVITAGLVVALAAGLVVSIQGPSGAAVLGFTVDTTSDAKDKSPGDGRCETSSGTCSLRAAIQEMDKLGQSTNNITLPSGTYTLSIGGTSEEWAAKGDLDIRVNMKIVGTVGSTTVKGGSGFGDRLFDVPQGTKPNVTLNGVILKAGAASSEGRGGGFRYRGTGSFDAINVTFSANSAGKSGGGYYQNSGSLTMNLITFDGNTAGTNGGGMDVEGSTVTANFTHLTFTDNTADRGGGLAAFLDSGATGSIPKLDNGVFTGNATTSGGSGGGLSIARTTLRSNTITGNTAGYGGGVELVGSTIPNDVGGWMDILDNTATISGGGVYTSSCGSSCGSLLHVVIEGNTAKKDGSGMYVQDGLTLEKVTINANTTQGQGSYGGAVYHTGSRGLLLMTNVTIGENTNGPVAGGIAVAASTVDQFLNITVADNSGGTANGIAVVGSGVAPQVRNTLLSSGGTNCNKALASLGHNLDSGNSCGLTKSGDLVNTDAMLHELEDNGGGTHTMRPKNLSPIRDVGDRSICPATDQRSVRRPYDFDGNGTATCDIGAYEDGPGAINSNVGFESAVASVSGSTATYTLTLKNTGAFDSLNSIATDLLPSTLSFSSCSATKGGVCSHSGNTVTVTYSSVELGSAPVVTIKAVIQSSSKIVNTTTVWSDNPDWYPVDNTASMTIQG
jgi:uncharacterized repeat protein (TIGR01451 family)/CSLREA domain-containing protein